MKFHGVFAALSLVATSASADIVLNPDLKVDALILNAKGRGEFSAELTGKGINELAARLPLIGNPENQEGVPADTRSMRFYSPSAYLVLSCSTYKNEGETQKTCYVAGLQDLPEYREAHPGETINVARDILPNIESAQRSGAIAAEPLPLYKVQLINVTSDSEGSTIPGDSVRIRGGDAGKLNDILPNFTRGSNHTTLRSMKFSDGKLTLSFTCVSSPTTKTECAVRLLK